MTSSQESNEQEGMYMLEDQDKREGRRQKKDTEREELQQATQHFLRSMFRFGVSRAYLTFNRLPRGPQRRLQAAGSEITRNLATFMRTLAEDVHEVTQPTTPSSSPGSDPHGESD